MSSPAAGSYVSYNGGTGGTTARPTAAQAAALQERHSPATAEQIGHRRAASTNRGLLASVNHGRPPVAATSRPGEFTGKNVVPARGAATENRAAQTRAVPAHPGESKAAAEKAAATRANESTVTEKRAPATRSSESKATTERAAAPHPSENKETEKRAAVAHSSESKATTERAAAPHANADRATTEKPAATSSNEDKTTQSHSQ